MAFQPFHFENIAPQIPAIDHFAESIAKGYQLGRMPQQIRQQEQQRDLANQLGQLKLQEEPGNNSMLQALRKAQIDKALRPPSPIMSNFEKALAGAQRVKQQYGEQSPQYSMINDYLKRQAAGNSTELSIDPKTGAVNFSTGSGGRGAPKSGVVDGNFVSTPTTGASTDQQKNYLNNATRESMANFFNNPYVGTGSNAQLLSDRALYSSTTDPQIKKQIGERLINAAVASKLSPEYANLQLSSQGVRSTVPALKHQQDALQQGWAEGMPLVVNNLPQELQVEAKRRHDKALQQLAQIRNRSFAQGFPIKMNEGNGEQKRKIETSKLLNGKTYVKINGEWYEQ